jgi:single-stranded-DNA-specific exonuclease
MELYNKFIDFSRAEGSNFIKDNKDKTQSILLVGHHDTDGLCGLAMLQQALDNENLSYKSINTQQIDDDFLQTIDWENYSLIFFVDVGSNKIESINEFSKEKNKNLKIYVLDHHKPSTKDVFENIIHINPFVFDIEVEKMISGAGVVYFFCQGMNSKNKSNAYLAILGAIGDTQENKGFEFLNNIILQNAILQKQISIQKELRLYGKSSRNLIKLLQYTTDINIPGITNDYKGVLSLLRELNIPLNWKGKPRKWHNLRDNEKELIQNRIFELKSDVDIDEITTNTYIFNNIPKRELRNAREYATIVNACGRLEDYNTAILALKGDKEAQEKAIMNLKVYKSEIKHALDIFDKRRESKELIEREKLIIFDSDDLIKPNIIGVVASIIARNKYYTPETIICSIAKTEENKVKISLRASHDKTDLNLSDLLQEIVSEFGSNAGGHPNAAGAIIPMINKEQFLEKLLSKF